ncbi:MAG: class I SAM-dependent methyltransferase [Polyangiaceae bacterium]
MRRSSTMFFAAMLLTACGSAPTPPDGPPADQHDHQDAAHAHGAGHSHAHAHADHDGGGMHHRFADANEWAKVFDDPERDVWQRPDEVLRALELGPAMVVADVGAGTGYFSVRLARAVPQGEVIATDVEPDMVRYLDERARREQLGNMRAVRAGQAVSGLAPHSVDRILVVDVWHHLGDRVAYARDLGAALRPGGKLLVVDFTLQARRGPPVQHRLAPEAIAADLAAAGLTAKVSAIALPDQYIVEARPAP